MIAIGGKYMRTDGMNGISGTMKTVMTAMTLF